VFTGPVLDASHEMVNVIGVPPARRTEDPHRRIGTNRLDEPFLAELEPAQPLCLKSLEVVENRFAGIGSTT
jgi:hypothetical protein